MKANYPKAYTEVLEILKHMPKDDVNKIPKELIDMFEYKKDKDYQFIIDDDEDFSNIVILDETEAIMLNIFKDYWATPEQKEIFEEKQQSDLELIDEEKKKKYGVGGFDSKEKKIERTENDTKLPVETEKKGFYYKFINFLKKIFHIN